MLPGMLYLVSTHMVPLVPRGPVGKVYRDVTEAFYVDLTSEVKWSGKGLSLPDAGSAGRWLKRARRVASLSLKAKPWRGHVRRLRREGAAGGAMTVDVCWTRDASVKEHRAW